MSRHAHTVIALAAGFVAAVSAVGLQAAGNSAFVAVGANYTPDYEGSDDYDPGPVVAGQYRWANGRYVQLTGSDEAGNAARLRSNLLRTEGTGLRWELGPVLQYRVKRNSVGNNRVDEFEKVDDTVEAGAFVGLLYKKWEFNLHGVADIGSEHDGGVVDFAFVRNFTFAEKWHLGLGASASWADSNYMDTYFGVSRRDSLRSGLKEYDADSGIKDVGLQVTGAWDLTKHWGLFAYGNYFRLLSDAEDSPIVDDEGDENQFGGGLAVTYRW